MPALSQAWEIVMSTYLLVSIQANYFQLETVKAESEQPALTASVTSSVTHFGQHQWWEPGRTWKSTLNNLRLIIQPYIFYCLIRPWLQMFKIPHFRRAFLKLIDLLNQFHGLSIPNLFRLSPLQAIAC